MNKKFAYTLFRTGFMKKIISRTLGCFALAASFVAPAAATDIPMDTVVYGNLDKVTGRVNTMSGGIDTPIRFGTLEVVTRACFTRPPEEPPENAAFVEVFDIPEEGDKKKVFSGWMYASSPALS